MIEPAPHREPTPVDALAEAYLDEYAALDPAFATSLGLPGHDARLPGYTPDWLGSVSELRCRVLRELDAAAPLDATDRVTIAALRSKLDTDEQLRGAGADTALLNVIESPLQAVREVFDLMPVSTVQDWAVVALRLTAVPAALAGHTQSLRHAADSGLVSARRQVRACAEQCDDNTGPTGFFARLAADAATADGTPLPDSLRADLARGAQTAAAGYEQLATFLRDELLDQATDQDSIGTERYLLHSRAFLGTTIDPAEAYAWGQDELARIDAEMAATADRIRPGASTAEALALLDESPTHRLTGTAALQEWMQRTSDEAVSALAGTHFDIPDAIRTLECRIAPTTSGGIYYSGPSDDLVTRPGRMWWSVPKGVTEFATWRERTTVYHEGVPGHHLQIGQTAYRRNILNRWRRLASWISGHGEGWALYAERLMADLGFLDDPADYLGMLDGQALRAARVVLDIGIHCRLPAPPEVGGGSWTYDKGWQFLTSHSTMAEGFLRFEFDRYLGWPGQAPSYKLGERTWLQLRDESRAREGDKFELATFHRRALDVGSVGLDVLRTAVLDI